MLPMTLMSSENRKSMCDMATDLPSLPYSLGKGCGTKSIAYCYEIEKQQPSHPYRKMPEYPQPRKNDHCEARNLAVVIFIFYTSVLS